MAISFTCTCGKTVQVGDEFAGREGQCPSCGRTLDIPADGQFTAQEPSIAPKRKGAKPAPWDELPTIEPIPEREDDDDVAQLVTHAGLPIEPSDDFFVEAPKEIGRVHSAFTTLKTDVEPKTLGVRLIIAGICFPLGFAIAVLIFWLMRAQLWAPRELVLPFFVCVAAGLIPAGIALWLTRFRHSCSYVGAKGVATFHCSGSRADVAAPEVFFFRDATDLRIAQTRHYYNGVYTGTNYAFTWSDERGKVVYTLAGRYSSEAGTPPPADPFHFALSAEIAWTMYLFRDIDRTIKAGELLFFSLGGGNYIELGPGLFILVQSGNRIELRNEQIEKMTIGDGVISVWETGAKQGWFVNKGIHQFMYADVGNARFFLYALDRLLGIRF